MKTTANNSGGRSLAALFAVGSAAGFANGLLGAGGGIIIVFGLTPLFAGDAGGGRDVFANALAVMLPVSVVSVISYTLSGRNGGGFGLYVIPAALGGLLGAFLLDRIRLPWLRRLFALVVIWSGIYLILRS